MEPGPAVDIDGGPRAHRVPELMGRRWEGMRAGTYDSDTTSFRNASRGPEATRPCLRVDLWFVL